MVYHRKRPALDPCPVEAVLAMVAGKWKARVLYLLSLDDLTFGEVRASVGNIRQQVLATVLSEMRASGIVRRADDCNAKETRYALTERGRELVQLLLPLSDWGNGLLAEKGELWRAPRIRRKSWSSGGTSETAR
ncbi:DNA-binding HxlR family transcriptional regulator [Bradyrhizobium sp. AZCC 1678]|uniref:DNA-binding HxlR family transcriptional regulator n=1 Tax=Bradyrhizobium algeriense TaxID=634784 RepID=A0ABU8BNI7_9BRAD